MAAIVFFVNPSNKKNIGVNRNISLMTIGDTVFLYTILFWILLKWSIKQNVKHNNKNTYTVFINNSLSKFKCYSLLSKSTAEIK